MVELARQKNCKGIICGHIHHPDIKQYENITYYNSGDWVESLSALVENYNGVWEILHYNDLVKQETAIVSSQMSNIDFVIPKLHQIKIA